MCLKPKCFRLPHSVRSSAFVAVERCDDQYPYGDTADATEHSRCSLILCLTPSDATSRPADHVPHFGSTAKAQDARIHVCRKAEATGDCPQRLLLEHCTTETLGPPRSRILPSPACPARSTTRRWRRLRLPHGNSGPPPPLLPRCSTTLLRGPVRIRMRTPVAAGTGPQRTARGGRARRRRSSRRR